MSQEGSKDWSLVEPATPLQTITVPADLTTEAEADSTASPQPPMVPQRLSRDEKHHIAIALATDACVARGLCVFDSAEAMIEFFELEAVMPLPVGGAAGAVAQREKERRREERAEKRAQKQLRMKALGDVPMKKMRPNGDNTKGNPVSTSFDLVSSAATQDDIAHRSSKSSTEEGERGRATESDGSDNTTSDDEDSQWWRPYFVPSALTKSTVSSSGEMIPASALPGDSQWARYRYTLQPEPAPDTETEAEASQASNTAGGGVIPTVASAAIALPTSLLYYSLYVPTQLAWFTASAAAKTITKAITAPLSWWSVEKSKDWSEWVRVGYTKRRKADLQTSASQHSASPLVLSNYSLNHSALTSPNFSDPLLSSAAHPLDQQHHHHYSGTKHYALVGTEPQSQGAPPHANHSEGGAGEEGKVENASFASTASSMVGAVAAATMHAAASAVAAAASIISPQDHRSEEESIGENGYQGTREQVIFLPAMQLMTSRVLDHLTGKGQAEHKTNETNGYDVQQTNQDSSGSTSGKYLQNPFLRVFTCDEWVDFLLELNIKSGEAITEHLILTQNITPLEVELDISEADNKEPDEQMNEDDARSSLKAKSCVVKERALFFPLTNNKSGSETEEDAKAVARWKLIASSLDTQVGYWEGALEQAQVVLQSLEEEEKAIREAESDEEEHTTSASALSAVSAIFGSGKSAEKHAKLTALANQRESIEREVLVLKNRIHKNKLVSIECNKLHQRLSKGPSPASTDLSPLTLRQIVSRIDALMDNFGVGPWPQL